jgi:hypothetical protein
MLQDTTPMLSEVHLIIGAKEARLILKKNDDFVEDELWKFDRKMSSTEANEMVRVVFDGCFDLMNNLVHGSE